MAEKKHSYKGYVIERGAYYGTNDDRADRWYVGNPKTDYVDRRGSGYATLAAAKTRINELIEQRIGRGFAGRLPGVVRALRKHNKRH